MAAQSSFFTTNRKLNLLLIFNVPEVCLLIGAEHGIPVLYSAFSLIHA
jgi:hypothetical protein